MPRRVLIVDEEPSLSEMFREAAATIGMDVWTVRGCAEAADYLYKEKFDLVLLGVHMPSLDAIDLTRQIRDLGRNRLTPVIVVCDDQELAAGSLALDAGASFLLYRPVDQEKLVKLIRAAHDSLDHERRRFRRVACRTKVRLKSETYEMQGETVDISLDGILVRVATTIPAHSTVRVALYLLRDAKPVLGVGSVARVIGVDRMGIHLVRISARESAKLQDFLWPLITEGASPIARSPHSA
jgi:DNA-binding response OmpR family regulator